MIELKNFVATNDKRPGQNRFTVTGTVVVPSSEQIPMFTKSEMPHSGDWEFLHLQIIKTFGGTEQGNTEQPITFERNGCSPFSKLEIAHADGSIFIDITSIE